MKIKHRIISFITATITIIATTTAYTISASPLTLYGDANNDGVVNMADCVYIINYLNGLYPRTSYFNQCDYDQSHVVSYMDAYKIQMSLLGYNTSISEPDNMMLYDNYLGDDYNIYNAQTGAYSNTYTLGSSLNYFYNNDSVISDTEDEMHYNKVLDQYRSGGVIGDDDREVDWTNNGTVKLFNGNNFVGSGFIVAPHVIATAAHCVMSYNSSLSNQCCPITSIYLFNSSSSSSSQDPSLITSPVTIHVPCEFISRLSSTSASNQYDYALITVSDSLTNYPCFELGVGLDSAVSNNKMVNVSGFPGEFTSGSNTYYNDLQSHYLVCASGQLTNNFYYNDKQFTYTADMSPGESGGPVFIEESYVNNTNSNYSRTGKKVVIAINCASADTYNIGTRINDEQIHFYKNNNRISWS